MTIAIELLLAVAVLAAWLGCAGFARLRAPLDRLHCTAFVNATSGVAVTLAVFLADGASTRALKTMLILGCCLVGGAASSHAISRAVTIRSARFRPGPPERQPQ